MTRAAPLRAGGAGPAPAECLPPTTCKEEFPHGLVH